MYSVLHSSVWKRKRFSCDWPGPSQLDRTNTGFQILTTHGVNIFKKIFVHRSNLSIQGECDRLVAFFTLRAETHTIMDQLWSAAHLSSFSYPSTLSYSSGWHCCSTQAVGTPLSIPNGSRLYQNCFLPGFPLKGLLYLHLELGAMSNNSYRVASQWPILLGAIRPCKWEVCFSSLQLKLQALSPNSVWVLHGYCLSRAVVTLHCTPENNPGERSCARPCVSISSEL